MVVLRSHPKRSQRLILPAPLCLRQETCLYYVSSRQILTCSPGQANPHVSVSADAQHRRKDEVTLWLNESFLIIVLERTSKVKDFLVVFIFALSQQEGAAGERKAGVL